MSDSESAFLLTACILPGPDRPLLAYEVGFHLWTDNTFVTEQSVRATPCRQCRIVIVGTRWPSDGTAEWVVVSPWRGMMCKTCRRSSTVRCFEVSRPRR